MNMKKDKPAEENGTGAPEFTMPDDSAAYALAEAAGWHLLDKVAQNVVVMDLRGRSDVCDFFVLGSGQSANQVRALAKHLHNELLDAGHKPKGLEGMNDGRWALLDFFDVVVHVFDEKAREYFQLERLWGDAPRRDLDPAWFADPAVAARHPGLKFTFANGSGAPD
jgi:ribosome-associated protein